MGKFAPYTVARWSAAEWGDWKNTTPCEARLIKKPVGLEAMHVRRCCLSRCIHVRISSSSASPASSGHPFFFLPVPPPGWWQHPILGPAGGVSEWTVGNRL